MPDAQYVALTAPTPAPSNIAAKKYYVFNQTGNIMMSTTDDASHEIQKSVRDVFAEVAVFFAAMTKAITTTPNPAVKGQNYTIYNYAALSSIIGGSGLFVNVTQEDVEYSSTSVGAEFSEQLIQALIGLATGEGELSFASAMLTSIGSEAKNIQANYSSSNSSVANVIFVCEYLLGMPIVSALVVYADVQQNKSSFSAGPCFKTSSTHTKWQLHKDTYLFVTPTFVKKYAGDLYGAEQDPAYASLVGSLADLLTQTPTVTGVFDNGKAAPSALTANASYQLTGTFLGTTQGVLKFVGAASAPAITVGTWFADSITFSVADALTTGAPIGVYASSAATTPIAQTSTSYTVQS